MKKSQGKAIMFVMCLLCLLPMQVNGNESKTLITYTNKEYTSYSFKIETQGNGNVYDGEQMIRNGSVEYGLHIEETKTFKLIPDKGYEVAHIYYSEVPRQSTNQEPNRKDIKDQMVGDEIHIKAVGGDMLLQVEFVEQTSITEDPSLGNNTTTDKSTSDKSIANTGDIHNNVLFTWFLIFAYFILLYAKHALQKEQE